MEKNINKIIWIIFIGLLLTAIIIAGYFIYQTFSSKKTIHPTDSSTLIPATAEVTYTGLLKMGRDIQSKKSYCTNEAYIIINGQPQQVRAPDDSDLLPDIYFEQFLNRKVDLQGKTSGLIAPCDTNNLNCLCDPYVLTSKISLSDDFDFIKKGTLNCLPENSENCSLILITNDKEEYLLSGLTKEEVNNISQEQQVEIRGTLDEDIITIVRVGKIKVL